MSRLKNNIGKQLHLQQPQNKNQMPSYKLNKDANDLYKENYKSLKKVIEED
jgi:hypothetical protein